MAKTAQRPRRPRFATDREMEALVYLAASPRPVGAAAIGRGFHHDHDSRAAADEASHGRAILEPLVSLALVEVLGRYRYALTERGRIAAALILFRRPAMLAAFLKDSPARKSAVVMRCLHGSPQTCAGISRQPGQPASRSNRLLEHSRNRRGSSSQR